MFLCMANSYSRALAQSRTARKILRMNILFTLLAHLLRSIAIVFQPGGCKSLIAENLLLKQQLLVLNRSRKRAPNIPPIQRLFIAVCCQFLKRRRIECSSITFIHQTDPPVKRSVSRKSVSENKK